MDFKLFLIVLLTNFASTPAYDNTVNYIVEHKKTMSQQKLTGSAGNYQGSADTGGINMGGLGKNPADFFNELYHIFSDDERAELYKIALNLFEQLSFDDSDFNSILNYINVYLFAATSATKTDFTYKDIFLAFKPFYDLPAKPAFLLVFKIIVDTLNVWSLQGKNIVLDENPESILETVQNGIRYIDKSLRSSLVQDFFK